MKLTGQRNQCPTCSKYFNSNYAFDKHRVGAFEQRKKNGVVTPSTRRCASESEMHSMGMSISSTGWWISSKKPDNLARDR